MVWWHIKKKYDILSLVQYCCTLLHITSYWSRSSAVIVLLHKILFVLNFYFTYVFQYYYLNIKILKFYENWNLWNFMKILKSYENFEFLWIFGNFWNLEIFWKFWNFELKFFVYVTYVFQYYYLNIKILKFYENWNFIHWFCTRVQYIFFIGQKLLFANQYVRKWNVTCIVSGQ